MSEGPTLLVADDEEQNRKLLSAIFRAEGYRVVLAENGETALARAVSDQPSLALLDLRMPGMGGMAALARLRAIAPHLAVIILTSHGDLSQAVEAIRLGADDFLIRPINNDKLVLAAQRALERRQLMGEIEGFQESVRARDTFLSVAAHELRTPLTALTLSIQHLLHEARMGQAAPLGASILGELQAIARQCKRLARLVANLLDVSQLTAGHVPLQPENVDLAEVARDVVSAMREELAQAGCPTTLRADAPAVGTWDRLRLEQVATNLISNAAKYGQGRPIDVIVEGTGATARLAVRDLGIGIAPEDQARIFERFERAVSIRHYGGFGLGLWITRQIVSAMGGEIRVESQPGAGSTFTVELPCVRPPEASG
jgi:signal transduction histidine kinase